MENFIFCAVFAIILKRGTVQKMKFSIKGFFSNCDQMQGSKI